MRILGIDPGARITGYGLLDLIHNQLQIVGWGTFRSGNVTALPERLKRLTGSLAELLCQQNPDVCAFESVFFSKNPRTTLTLGHVRGALLLSVVQAGIPVAEYSPLEVKRAVSGYGRAEKEQVRKMVVRLLAIHGAELPSVDAADALAVALCHAHTVGNTRHPVG